MSETIFEVLLTAEDEKSVNAAHHIEEESETLSLKHILVCIKMIFLAFLFGITTMMFASNQQDSSSILLSAFASNHEHPLALEHGKLHKSFAWYLDMGSLSDCIIITLKLHNAGDGNKFPENSLLMLLIWFVLYGLGKYWDCAVRFFLLLYDCTYTQASCWFSTS